MKTKQIKFYFSLIFIIGFFFLTFMMFWVEASDTVNMSKGENSFLNEIDMLLGIIVAAMGQIIYYWFGRSSTAKQALAQETVLPPEEAPTSHIIGGASSEPMAIVPQSLDLAQSYADMPPPQSHEIQIEVAESSAQDLSPEKELPLQEDSTKTGIDKPFWFSVIFIVGYFLVLFIMIYFQTSGSKYVEQGNDNFLDILIILLGVLTAGISQILNYWFKKENRQEMAETDKAIIQKLVNRERNRAKAEPKQQATSQATPETTADPKGIKERVERFVEQVTVVKPSEDKPVKEQKLPKEPIIEAEHKVKPPLGPPVVSGNNLHPSINFLLAIKSVNKANLQKITPYLEDFEQRYAINTPLRRAHFYAQLAHESGAFKATEENLNYSAESLVKVFKKYFPTLEVARAYARKPEQIANKVYAGKRLGNGDEASGDGYKFRGRGFIQITGRANYQALSNDLKVDFVNNPDWLTQPQYLLEAAGWFWKKNRLNDLADKDDVRAISKSINGGYNGLADREHNLSVLKKALGI